jgi:dimethylhistidine N-methyltransferase
MPEGALLTQPPANFAAAVLDGLSRPQKVIFARFLYDCRGSELFEEITRLPEYYPTRTETSLLEVHGPDVSRLCGPGRVVVEFGSGSSAKTPLLLRHVAPAAYVPVDISKEFLAASARALAAAHPGLDVLPVAADFSCPFALPPAIVEQPKLGFFAGSTIGNMTPAAAVDLLRAFRTTLGGGSQLLIGVDLRKDPRLIEAAYDDAAGVTAAFNLNLLQRINRELGGDVALDAFRHRAVWNNILGRIEMHLAAARDISFSVAGRRFVMAAGETIHTENSHKYYPEEVALLARVSGWEPIVAWSDPDHLFSLNLWETAADRLEP